MADAVDALRATSDAMLRKLDALSSLEDEKRRLTPNDPRLVELARRIEEASNELLTTTVRQRDLTEQVHADAVAGGPSARGHSIEETPRDTGRILAEWRDAERHVGEAAEGSPERIELESRIRSLREEYRLAYEAARRRQ